MKKLKKLLIGPSLVIIAMAINLVNPDFSIAFKITIFSLILIALIRMNYRYYKLYEAMNDKSHTN